MPQHDTFEFSWLPAFLRNRIPRDWKRKSVALDAFYHSLSFVPCAFTALLAAWVGSGEAALAFLYLTLGAVSLEVAYTCFLAKLRHSEVIDEKLKTIVRFSERDALHEEKREARIQLKICGIAVFGVLFSWFLIAVCEADHLRGGSNEQKHFVAAIGHIIAPFLSGINFIIAEYKIWAHANEMANEF